jgi:hypothetical protein
MRSGSVNFKLMEPKNIRFCAIGFFNLADTLESSSILIYFKQMTKAFWEQVKLSKLKSSFEESLL